MEEIAQKYPLAHQSDVLKLYKEYQYATVSAYQGFLEYYEKHKK